MSFSIAVCLRRFLCSVVLLSLSPATQVVAQGSHCDPDYVPVVDWPSQCNHELEGTEGYCVWEDRTKEPEYEIMAMVIVGLGDEDASLLPSMAAERIASTAPTAPTDSAKSKVTDDGVASDAAVFTTTLFGLAGVKVHQIIEPFAMVASQRGDQLMQQQIAGVDHFLTWWSTIELDQPQDMDIEDRILQLAQAEPIDISIEADQTTESIEQAEPAIEVTRLDHLVGSGPMIVTIRETYMPYDLSQSDLQLWDIYPNGAHPFCVRTRMQEEKDALALRDTETEAAMVQAREFIQWVKNAATVMMQYADELSQQRIATAKIENRSL